MNNFLHHYVENPENHLTINSGRYKIVEKYENNTLALEDAGIAYACDQIVDLITSGVDGIHLYTMNKSKAAIKIYEAVKHLLKEELHA